MNGILTVAGLTVREAIRRRLIGAFALITIALVALSAWGFDRLSHSGSLTSGEQRLSDPQALIIFMFMFSFVVALSASAMGSPVIGCRRRVRRVPDDRRRDRSGEVRSSSVNGSGWRPSLPATPRSSPVWSSARSGS